MFKFIVRLLLILTVLLLALILTRNDVGIWIAENALEELTGFEVVIGRLDVKLNKPILIARDITLRNPKGLYREPLAMKIDLVEAEYEPASLLHRKPHFQRLTIEIREAFAVKNVDGQLNLSRLQRPAVRAGPRPAQHGDFKIDELTLSIDKISYLNERRDNPTTEVYPVHTGNRIHKNIDDPEAVKKLVINLILQSLPANLLDPTSKPVSQPSTPHRASPVKDSQDGTRLF